MPPFLGTGRGITPGPLEQGGRPCSFREGSCGSAEDREGLQRAGSGCEEVNVQMHYTNHMGSEHEPQWATEEARE